MQETLVERLRGCLEQTPTAIDAGRGQAAVVLALTAEPRPQLLLIRRSLNLSLHPGEIAFPGGKLESGDADLRAAAQREAWEEVALAPELFVVCGELTPRISAWGLGVTAVVGVIPPGLELRAQASEVDELIWAPLDYFVDAARLRMDRIWRGGVQRNAARYQYLHYTVWGMTAGFIVELVNRFYNAGLDVINQAPAGQRPLLLGETK